MKRPVFVVVFFFQPNILNAKITPSHHLCWWVQRLLMAFYPVAFPFLLAFSLLSGEVVTHQCKRDGHIWICQYDSCLFLFLMSTTCLTLTEGLFPRSVLTSKSLSREPAWIATFLVRQEGIRLLAVGVLWALPALAWCSQWTERRIWSQQSGWWRFHFVCGSCESLNSLASEVVFYQRRGRGQKQKTEVHRVQELLSCKNLKGCLGVRKDGSVLKSTECSCRGPRFNS